MTIAAGLGEPIATGAAAWGDYDNDGRVDPFVCGEFCHRSSDAGAAEPDPRNRCRLYHNRGDGRFDDVAKVAGGVNERCARGAAWGENAEGRQFMDVTTSSATNRRKFQPALRAATCLFRH